MRTARRKIEKTALSLLLRSHYLFEHLMYSTKFKFFLETCANIRTMPDVFQALWGCCSASATLYDPIVPPTRKLVFILRLGMI